MTTGYHSFLALQIGSYVELKRSLGLQFRTQEGILKSFDRFLSDKGCDCMLTERLVLEFASGTSKTSKRQKAKRYHVVRHFFSYLAAFRDVPSLSPKAMRYVQRRSPPYVFSESSLERLLQEVHRSYSGDYCKVTYRTIIGLGVSAGLRISEIIRMNKLDANLANGILTIRRTKFNKDRIVPIHPSTVSALRDYAGIRDERFPTTSCQAFFINSYGRRCNINTIGRQISVLTRKAGLRPATGRPPTFHSLRHTFAVWRLASWYRQGCDLQAKLPMLATYMGHANYRLTAYYLTATAEILGLAIDRLERFSQGEEVCLE